MTLGNNSKKNMARTSPNIIVTGTPGVGKTSHSEALAERTGLKHLVINQIVKDRACHEGWDDEYQSWIVDEDKVCGDFPVLNKKPLKLTPSLSCWTP
jgi:broad-specificity NMP kinase